MDAAAPSGISRQQAVGVISAVVFRDRGMAEVLLGVRRPTPLVKRFPGVVSTPTMGVPWTVFQTLDPGIAHREQQAQVEKLAQSPWFAVGGGGYLSTAGGYALEHLMARKLGLAPALVMGRFRATARLWARSLDNVSDPLGTEEQQWTAMLTYLVTVGEGAEEVPAETSSYSRLLWAPIETARAAILARDALILDEDLNPFEVCLQGLCLRSIVGLPEELESPEEQTASHTLTSDA
ncbi:hypothetical protein [Micromonospora sp. NPDC005171]|uniref:hypothetical protein n=1 Tax=Micromonospora sp. NPDC005171 TaxID=3156866 RepID=UPI0033B1F149